jgi:ATP-dependent helicase HrpA
LYVERAAAAEDDGASNAPLQRLRWMLEEMRVSMFAQDLRTVMPVSMKRLEQARDAVVGPVRE